MVIEIPYGTAQYRSLIKRKIIATTKKEKTNHPIWVIYSFYNWENRQRPNALILFQTQIIRRFKHRHSKTANIKPGPFEHSRRDFTNPLPCSTLFSCGRNIQKVDFYPAKGYIVSKRKNRTMNIPKLIFNKENKIMRKAIVLILLLTGCAAVKVPPEFVYREIQTRDFTLATWQKITDPDGVYKIYIEGDGHAFNARGRATNDPTPRGTLVRELAFGDPSPNVVYLSRPCQYVKSEICSKRHWTTARFAPEIINAEYDAVRQIAGNSPIILIGFSGGAQAAGLIAAAKPGLNVEEIITVAGNLDHLAWTQYQKVPPLNESLNLESYRKQFAKIPQTHYVGGNDKVIPPFLVKEFVGSGKRVIKVPNATHNSGWESIYPQIWEKK